MKQMTSYNRVAGYLNRIYDALNTDLFAGELPRPTLTIQSTPRAYGHYSTWNAWDIKGQGQREINLGAGTLARPIEEVVSTLTHEMCHYWNDLHGVQDCSRGGTYHNKKFKDAAEAHGLIVTKSDKYGWAHTAPGDAIIEFCLVHELTEIEINRNETAPAVSLGTGSGNCTTTTTSGTDKKRSGYIRHQCPTCGLTARTTRKATLICGDCLTPMEITD